MGMTGGSYHPHEMLHGPWLRGHLHSARLGSRLSTSTNKEAGVVKSRGQLGGRADTTQDRWGVPESEDCRVPCTGHEAWQQLVH